LARKHDPDEKSVCRRCGAKVYGEFVAQSDLYRRCTGNAYVCRVARKLYPLVEQFESVPRGFWGLQPWNLDGEDFAQLVTDAVESRCLRSMTATVRGLLESVEENPGCCAILADSLEEADCTDAALLAALRTP
jgi:hypothetical protein